jgi:hypothetical protein
VIQKQVGDADRKPTLVIYEDAYALSDLESPEQYRIFVRHVLPSERLWDGMFTVFLESGQPDGDWKILQSYASMTLDLRSHMATDSGQGNTEAHPQNRQLAGEVAAAGHEQKPAK